MTDKTTAVSALRALKAAKKLQDAMVRLHQVYGVDASFTVSARRIGFGIDIENAPAHHREALMQDLADIIGADMQPEVDPDDLWVTWRGRGEHDEHGVHIIVMVAPFGLEAQA